MVDRYWRKIESVEDNIENSMQISSILLKLKEYDDKLNDIDTNGSNISSNLDKIGTNESGISCNLSKLNNIKNDMNIKIRKDIYEKTFIFPNMTSSYNSKKFTNIYINSNFTLDGIIKIDANYNYYYDNSNNFTHIYKFFNNNQKFKEIRLDHKSKVVKDKFNIPAANFTRINLLIYLVNHEKDNSTVELFDYNTVKITYDDKVDTSKIDMNTDNISSNLTKIGNNEANISSNLTKINNISDIKIQKGDDYYIVRNLYLLELNFVKNLKIDADRIEVLAYEKLIDGPFEIDDFLQLNESIYYDFDDVRADLHFIKEHYIIKDENVDVIYDFDFNISNRGFISRNSYIFKNKKFIKINKKISKLKIQLLIKRYNDVVSDTVINMHMTNNYQKNFISIKHYQKQNSYLVKHNIEELENKINELSSKLEKSNTLKNIFNILFYDNETQIDF